MSSTENVTSESRSSVAIEENSKGEPIVKVKCYAASTDIDAIDEAATKAVKTYYDVKANLA